MIARAFALIGLALLGACVGAVLGILAGIGYVWVADVSSREGQSGMLVFFAFGPLGALLGCIVAASAYIVRLMRRAAA